MRLYAIIVFGIAILLPILFLIYLELSSPAPPTTTGTTLKDREGVVIKDIEPENISGKVKLKNSSQVWSATAPRGIEEGAEVKINEVEGVHLKVEEIIEEEFELPEEAEETTEPETELVELESDISESEVCPSCETVITVYVEECPICGEELETSEEVEEKGFFKSFNNMIGSLRG